MTDITKYKSIAVKLDAYKKIQSVAQERYMSVGSFVRYLADKEFDKYNQAKETNQKETLKRRLLKSVICIRQKIYTL